ncbi:MAG: hypothetical protein LLG04_11820 [Parachlamydia sp.]|nr:hypothetical protein [Parachlamydia sp.]
MIAQVDGRALWYHQSNQDHDRCRRVILKFRNAASTQKPNDEMLPHLRSELTWNLCKELFGANLNDVVSGHAYLKSKLLGKPTSPIIEHPSWKKLFDKIVRHEMKSPRDARNKKALKAYMQVSPALFQLWQAQETAIQQVLENHNRQLAEIKFEKLTADIDPHLSPTANFRTALRSWAAHIQRVGNRTLQELFRIPNFTTELITWQLELIQELHNSIPGDIQPAPKPQLCLLCRKLEAFLNDLAPLRGAQHMHTMQLRGLSLGCHPAPQLPVESFPLSPHEINLFQADLRKYELCLKAHQELEKIASPIKLP